MQRNRAAPDGTQGAMAHGRQFAPLLEAREAVAPVEWTAGTRAVEKLLDFEKEGVEKLYARTCAVS